MLHGKYGANSILDILYIVRGDMEAVSIFDLYKNRKVIVTGHTGFKGSWLCKVLVKYGAEVVGYALEPQTENSLYNFMKMDEQIESVIGDVRDFEKMSKIFRDYKPEIVFHLAAQPIVRTSYKEPRLTYETNVMGTVNVCECIRNTDSVESFLNVTTDKVYKNNEWDRGYREDDYLDGFDPYSNSKSCSELVTHSYFNSFFEEMDVRVSTGRAGNVIGGGDFSVDRIIPDCVRATQTGETMIIRNPNSIRPYQHVLEPIIAYMMIAGSQIKYPSKQGSYNIGPDIDDCIKTIDLVQLFEKYYGSGFDYEIAPQTKGPHEANFLKLDTNLIRETFGYRPIWNIEEAVKRTVEWTKEWQNNCSAFAVNCVMEKQIDDYLKSFFNN